MSQGEDRDRKKYRIDIGAYGSIGIEAPTKERMFGALQRSHKN